MKLNPITALTDLFGKLIIEHGSAIIQEKHIALFKDELAILKEKFSVLMNENETLKTENQNQKIIIDELKKKIQVYEQTKEKFSHNTSLNDFKMKWGCLLFPGDKMKETGVRLKY